VARGFDTNLKSMKEPLIKVSLDRLPTFHEESAIFLANLLGLFFGNEAETRMLANEVGEIDSYGARLMPVMDLLYRGTKSNLLILEREPVACLGQYFTDQVDLSIPEVGVLPHDEYIAIGQCLEECSGKHDWQNEPGWKQEHLTLIDRLASTGLNRLDGYVTDRTLSALAQVTGMKTFSSIYGSQQGNNKWRLYTFLELNGLPTPRTEIAATAEGINKALQLFKSAGFQSAVVKAPLGASGIGMLKVNLQDSLELAAVEVPQHFFTEGPCLVQGWLWAGCGSIKRLYSPSAQLFLNDNEVVIYALTEQILSHHSIHEGNISPPPYLAGKPHWQEELLRQAAIVGKWLHKQGYRGTASADFILTEEEDSFTLYVCELNARVTGATYPAILASHFIPESVWILRNLRLNKPMSADKVMHCLQQSGCLFAADRETPGVFPISLNIGEGGLIYKGQFLFMADSQQQSETMLQKTREYLHC